MEGALPFAIQIRKEGRKTGRQELRFQHGPHHAPTETKSSGTSFLARKRADGIELG